MGTGELILNQIIFSAVPFFLSFFRMNTELQMHSQTLVSARNTHLFGAIVPDRVKCSCTSAPAFLM